MTEEKERYNGHRILYNESGMRYIKYWILNVKYVIFIDRKEKKNDK